MISRFRGASEEDDTLERLKAHTVYRLVVKTVKKNPAVNTKFKGASKQYATTSLCFINLAWPDKPRRADGTESQSKSDCSSSLFANKSLAALARCLRDLKEIRDGQNIHSSGNTWTTAIPGRLPIYKEFKLTRILYEYFYENSSIRFISHLNIAPFDIEEAFKTLNYTSQIKGNTVLCSSKFASVSKVNKDTTHKLLFLQENRSNNNSISKFPPIESFSPEPQTEAIDNFQALESLQPSATKKFSNKAVLDDFEPTIEGQTDAMNEVDEKGNNEENEMAIEEPIASDELHHITTAQEGEEAVNPQVDVTFAGHQFASLEESTSARIEKPDSALEDKVIEQEWYTQSAACPDQEETMGEQQIQAVILGESTNSMDNHRTNSGRHHSFLKEEKAVNTEEDATGEQTGTNEIPLLEGHADEQEAIESEPEFDIPGQKNHPYEYHHSIFEQSVATFQQEAVESDRDSYIPERILEQNLLEFQQDVIITDQAETITIDQNSKNMLDQSFLEAEDHPNTMDLQEVEEVHLSTPLTRDHTEELEEVHITSKHYSINSQGITAIREQTIRVEECIRLPVEQTSEMNQRISEKDHTELEEMVSSVEGTLDQSQHNIEIYEKDDEDTNQCKKTEQKVDVLENNIVTLDQDHGEEDLEQLNTTMLEEDNFIAEKQDSEPLENLITTQTQENFNDPDNNTNRQQTAVNEECIIPHKQATTNEIQTEVVADEENEENGDVLNITDVEFKQSRPETYKKDTSTDLNIKVKVNIETIDLDAVPHNRQDYVLQIDDEDSVERIKSQGLEDLEIVSEKKPMEESKKEARNDHHKAEYIIENPKFKSNWCNEAFLKSQKVEIITEEPEVEQIELETLQKPQKAEFVSQSPAFMMSSNKIRNKSQEVEIMTERSVQETDKRNPQPSDFEKEAKIRALEGKFTFSIYIYIRLYD